MWSFSSRKLSVKRLEAGRPHTLSEAEERVLGLSGELFGGPYKTFSVMNDADLKFPVIKDAAGADVRLTHGNYIRLLESADRNVRRDAMDKAKAMKKAGELTEDTQKGS